MAELIVLCLFLFPGILVDFIKNELLSISNSNFESRPIYELISIYILRSVLIVNVIAFINLICIQDIAEIINTEPISGNMVALYILYYAINTLIFSFILALVELFVIKKIWICLKSLFVKKMFNLTWNENKSLWDEMFTTKYYASISRPIIEIIKSDGSSLIGLAGCVTEGRFSHKGIELIDVFQITSEKEIHPELFKLSLLSTYFDLTHNLEYRLYDGEKVRILINNKLKK